MRWASLVVAAPVAALSFAACTTFGGDSNPPDPIADAGVDTGDPPDGAVACVPACAPGSTCVSGKCATACDAKVVYVSPAGDDASDGCAPTRPVRSLRRAVQLAEVFGGDGTYRVRACAGTYDVGSGLVVTRPIPIEGANDCATWSRSEEALYPGFGPTTRSTIIGSGQHTVLFDGAGARGRLDGFVVAASKERDSAAIGVVRGARPSLENVYAGGGDGAAGGDLGGRALLVEAASVDAKRSTFEGGKTNGSVGSIGVDLNADQGSTIDESILTGGTGVGRTVGSLALRVNVTTGETRVSRSFVLGGSGSSAPSAVSGYATMGIYFASTDAPGTSLTIEKSIVNGGSGTCRQTDGSCNVGAIVHNAGNLVVRGCSVFGGEAPTRPAVNIIGITSAGQNADLTVVNSFVHAGGNVLSPISAYGIVAQPVRSATIDSNTIVLGSADTIHGATGIAIGSFANATAVANNLVLGRRKVADLGLQVSQCTDLGNQKLRALEHNVFSEMGGGLVAVVGGTPCAVTESAGSADAVDKLGGAERSVGNLRTTASCPAPDTGCVVIGATLDAASNALFGLPFAEVGDAKKMMSAGLPLVASTATCRLRRGGLAKTTSPNDYYGKSRGNPRSIGAVEETSNCP